MASTTGDDHIERLLYSLTALADIGEATTAGGNFETTARELLHLILGTLGVSKGAILLHAADERELRVAVARGVDFPGRRFPLSAAVAKALIGLNAPVRLSDADGPFAPYVAERGADLDALHAHVWSPLIVGNRLIGVLSLSERFAKRAYGAEELQLLSTMTQHVSVALYNFQIIDEIRAANAKLNRKVLEMQSLYDVGLAISSLLDIKDLAREVVQRAVMLLDASQGVLFLTERDGLRVTASFGMEDEYAEDAFIALDAARPAQIAEVVIAKRCSCILNERDAGAPSAKNCLIMPLVVGQKISGAIMVCDKETRSGYAPFTDDDEQFLSAIATQAAIAIDNARLHREALEKERIEKELEVAAAIQRGLLPESAPTHDNIEIVGVNVSCRQVGGDYYDYIRHSDAELGIAIADVSGKGTPAALLVSTLQASFHALVENYDLAETVARLNKAIYKASPSYNYITFFYGILDLERRVFRSINAGHNDPLLLKNATSEWRRFESGGFCLGMFDWGTYEMQETSLDPGDIMFLYTDGVTESTNAAGEEFGEERARAVLERWRDRPLAEISEKLSSAIAEFVGAAPQHDDLTYVLARIK
jgi:sigma-B regulation protein RsbU (phosphoserine phosphatase)